MTVMALGHSSGPNQTELNYVKIKSHSGGLRPTLQNAVSLRKYLIKLKRVQWSLKINSITDRHRHVPLAEAMRPSNLDEYFGQDEVAGKSGFWRSLIQTGKIPSMILWGPPGCGKTR